MKNKSYITDSVLADITDLYLYHKDGKEYVRCMFHSEAKKLGATKLY